jgi:hypothetical protein
MKNAIIGVDFDGTCTTHEFPMIGKDIGAVPVLKALVKKGHRLILFTMRSNSPDTKGNGKDIADAKAGNYLDDAVAWFEKHGIPLYGVNENPDQKSWTSSPKPYCHQYIDDAALGCPLVLNEEISKRPYVDWERVRSMLVRKGLL